MTLSPRHRRFVSLLVPLGIPAAVAVLVGAGAHLLKPAPRAPRSDLSVAIAPRVPEPTTAETVATHPAAATNPEGAATAPSEAATRPDLATPPAPAVTAAPAKAPTATATATTTPRSRARRPSHVPSGDGVSHARPSAAPPAPTPTDDDTQDLRLARDPLIQPLRAIAGDLDAGRITDEEAGRRLYECLRDLRARRRTPEVRRAIRSAAWSVRSAILADTLGFETVGPSPETTRRLRELLAELEPS